MTLASRRTPQNQLVRLWDSEVDRAKKLRSNAVRLPLGEQAPIRPAPIAWAGLVVLSAERSPVIETWDGKEGANSPRVATAKELKKLAFRFHPVVVEPTSPVEIL